MTAELLSWSIETGYIDARGRPRTVEPDVVSALATSISPDGTSDGRRRVAVLQADEPPIVRISDVAPPLRWQLCTDTTAVADAESTDASIALPNGLNVGSYSLKVEAAGAKRDILILEAPEQAYQPELFRSGGRYWLLAVQLYAVRSVRNWGHGDFGDLANLLKIAGQIGAAGIGLNPLHALSPGEASPYSPSSRIFLNPLYIDVEAINEFPGVDACGLADDIMRLRSTEIIDYPAVHRAKLKGLRAAYQAFRQRCTLARRKSFEDFVERQGASLQRFALYEMLRERFGPVWQKWSAQWQDVERTCHVQDAADLGDTNFPAFIQWVADGQLRACGDLARAMSLPIGLYLDVAVGVIAGGADVWAAPEMLCRGLSIGAPPDIYNPRGQNWGLASFNPQSLIDSDFVPFRQILRSVMQYAGAIRIDHALGLNRLYLIPADRSAADGGYVRFPFEAMMAVTAQESARHRCLVIGEDLGTIPEGLCEALNRWGIWSYRVALFEREQNGAFRRPEQFPEKAIVTFNTHDLPTFAGWKSSHDLEVKAELGLDPGESTVERRQTLDAMRSRLGELGLNPELGFLDVLRYLARAHSQLLAVSMEDILGLVDQPNVPGTTNEHPNWRRRLPIDIDAFAQHESLRGVAEVMASEGRSCAKSRRLS
jgi:4-alpha-glucanotransferase